MAKAIKPEDRTVTRPVAEENNGAEALHNIEDFYEKNKKPINYIFTALIVVIGGFMAYKYGYQIPNEKKAAGKAFYAQQYFGQDSLDKALNGDDQRHWGFKQVIREYGSTKTGNLAHYYAGVCYLKQGDARNAIKQFEDFNGKGTLVATAAYGLLGDAYMETGNSSKAMDNYKKASENENDVVQTPKYLYNLGMASLKAKKNDDAKKAFERIRDEFPQSMQARDIDKNLAELGVIE